MPERGVARVVSQADRLRQILVQPERPGDNSGDTGGFEGVRHARPVVVAGGIDEDLRLALQTPERLRVQDAVTVPLKGCPHRALVLGSLAPTPLVRPGCERRELTLLERTNSRREGIGNSPCELGHPSQCSFRGGRGLG
jgi:hypothetical protein